MSELSLRDNMSECVDDIENIVKQIMDSLLNHRHQKSSESLTNLVKLFDTKQADLRQLLGKVEQFHERASLTRELEGCVKERDELINEVLTNLQGAELALTSTVFQANRKLKLVREAEARPVNSEAIIKVAHQISKGSSVAAPFNWQIGDPSRPFPTEPEFRESSLMTGRQTAHPTSQSYSLARQFANTQIRTPPQMGRPGGMPSPMLTQQKGLSPSKGFPGAVASPRSGQITRIPSGSLPGKTPPIQQTTPGQAQIKRPAQSPHTSSPNINIGNGQGPSASSTTMPLPVNQVENMSSDSSSSSSSDDETPS
ncbi:hypothetical protein WR25_19309 isoform A [Diploscapter pachys]|uniref:Mediator of RNA polymerase II transcription subunit 4 n=1 Tax=Diploscapter pachys TaxID=2018661 RepID=A0A2A2JUK6_9BILA|nr:hypothetical protein WR25_19309 isoform A [Diploscapter pachys]